MIKWNTDNLDRFVERRCKVAVGKMARNVRSTAKQLVGKQNRRTGSKPPRPPFKKSGELQRSIRSSSVKVDTMKISAVVGPTAHRFGRPYGLFLELGFLLKGITDEDGAFRPITPHQRQAPRPFMRPALDSLRGNNWKRFWA